MNTYDPADFILYVHMSRSLTPWARTDAGNLVESRLPSGYANQSPSTRLRSRGPLRASQSVLQFPLAADAVVPSSRPSSSPEPAASPGWRPILPTADSSSAQVPSHRG